MEPTSGAFSQKKKKKLQVQNSIFFGNIDTDKNFILNTKSEHKPKKRLGEKIYSCVRCRDLSYSEEKKKKKNHQQQQQKSIHISYVQKWAICVACGLTQLNPNLQWLGLIHSFINQKMSRFNFARSISLTRSFSEIGVRVNLEINNRLLENI